jgi:hypothetical protein
MHRRRSHTAQEKKKWNAKQRCSPLRNLSHKTPISPLSDGFAHTLLLADSCENYYLSAVAINKIYQKPNLRSVPVIRLLARA